MNKIKFKIKSKEKKMNDKNSHLSLLLAHAIKTIHISKGLKEEKEPILPESKHQDFLI